jgi:hypothetical protein
MKTIGQRDQANAVLTLDEAGIVEGRALVPRVAPFSFLVELPKRF